ncbi:MAG: metallophosphoesterase [Akkermansiaceae bacterium]
MMRLPVRIFSDVHLGHRASRVTDTEQLRPLIAGAGTVIFNGDTWEELARPWRERSQEMLGELKEMLNQEGCDSIFVPGNHDPHWQYPRYLSLAEGRIVITHGDALLRDSSPWKREILANQEVIDQIWNENPNAEIDLDARLKVANQIATRLQSIEHTKSRRYYSRVIDAALPPKRALAMLSAWIQQGRHGADFCEQYLEKAEFLVIGHFHHAVVRKNKGKTIINTGSFVVPGPARWVSWDGKFLETGRVLEKGGPCSLGGKSHTWNLIKKS